MMGKMVQGIWWQTAVRFSQVRRESVNSLSAAWRQILVWNRLKVIKQDAIIRESERWQARSVEGLIRGALFHQGLRLHPRLVLSGLNAPLIIISAGCSADQTAFILNFLSFVYLAQLPPLGSSPRRWETKRQRLSWFNKNKNPQIILSKNANNIIFNKGDEKRCFTNFLFSYMILDLNRLK